VGGYVGHTTASCRSISDPSVHAGGPPHFAWPLVPHPATAGSGATIAALRAAVEQVGRDRVLGLVYELVQERTGAVLPPDFIIGLQQLRAELDLPLICVETTTHTYRSGRGAFLSPALGLVPDVLTWWGGGQTGYVHTTSKWYVGSPLTLVSTWDGDELSLVRQHHQLRAARHVDVAGASAALERFGVGLGAYRVLDGGPAVADALAVRGIRVRRFPNGKLGVIPGLDQISDAAAALREALP
jgi:hypothetical protein